MSFDIKATIGAIAPTLATMLCGPLAGTAVGALMNAFGLSSSGDMSKDTAAITKVVQSGNMTPEIIAAVRKADQEHEEKMAASGIDLAKLNASHEEVLAKTFTEDTQDARKNFGQQSAILYMGIAVLITFAAVMALVLYACFELLSGGITLKDVTVVAAIAGMVGSVVGYVAANAQQVVSYFFGSSHGSETKTQSMGDYMGSLVKALGNKNTGV